MYVLLHTRTAAYLNMLTAVRFPVNLLPKRMHVHWVMSIHLVQHVGAFCLKSPTAAAAACCNIQSQIPPISSTLAQRL